MRNRMRNSAGPGVIAASTLMIGAVVLLIGALVPLPLLAQAPFATNTPAPTAAVQATPLPTGPLFATNTPPPDPANRPIIAPNTPVPTPVTPPAPDAPLDNYALRLWLEQDIIDLAAAQMAQLRANDQEAVRAVQLTLYEMTRRFPGAPNNPEQRQRLITAGLAAPVGAVDLRSLVRPFIEGQLNAAGAAPGDYDFAGFEVQVSPANLDGGRDDALVSINYAIASAEGVTPRYQDYVLAVRTGGGYRFLPQTYDLPAAPFGALETVLVDRLEDVNRDGQTEVVLRALDGQVSERLLIIGARNGLAVELVPPGMELRVGRLVSWPTDNPENRSPELDIVTYEARSTPPDWPCVAEIPVTWTYSNNFYTPSTGLNARLTDQESLACTLLNAEPILAREPDEVIDLLNDTLERFGLDVPGAQRALMVLAMAYTLNGDVDPALAIAQSVRPVGDDTSWIAQQSQAMIDALSVPSNTALDICVALARASEHPACDVDGVLAFYFTRLQLSTSEDLVTQLNAASLPVREAVPVNEVGRARRIVVQFALDGAGWWAFAPQPNGSYRVEPAEAPPGFEAVTGERIQRIEAPPAAYDALLFANDPLNALNVLDTLIRNNPGLPTSPEVTYMRALLLDLTGSRAEARTTYYALWQQFPANRWGQLAGAHLERR